MLGTADLIALFDSPNGWRRDMAQQLLIQRHDPAATSLLKERAAGSADALCRLHALCTLDGLAALDAPLVQRALGDLHPGVRRNAIRLAEPLLGGSPELGPRLVAMVDDPDPQVRLQLACSLGYSTDPAAGRALSRLLMQGGDDRFTAAAAISSITRANVETLVDEVIAGMKNGPLPPGAVDGLVRSANAFGGSLMTLRLLSAASPEGRKPAAAQFNIIAAMLDALDQAGASVATLSKDPAPHSKPYIESIARLFDAARATAPDANAPPSDRAAALRMLGRGASQQQEDLMVLASFLSPQSAHESQSAAADTLGKRRDAQSTGLLLHGWKVYGPVLRTQVLDALLSRADGADGLLDAVEHREMSPAEIDPARRQRLLLNKSASIRARAVKLLAAATNSDRAKVVESYREALTLTGDVIRGKELFAKTCAICHQLGEVGMAVGPDLASIGNKIPEGLLTSILDPNQAIEPRYTAYLAETQSGDSYTGILASESGNAISLVVPGGQQKIFLRTDLKILHSAGLSLMPDGLEAGLSRQDVADLIALIRTSPVRAGNSK